MSFVGSRGGPAVASRQAAGRQCLPLILSWHIKQGVSTWALENRLRRCCTPGWGWVSAGLSAGHPVHTLPSLKLSHKPLAQRVCTSKPAHTTPACPIAQPLLLPSSARLPLLTSMFLLYQLIVYRWRPGKGESITAATAGSSSCSPAPPPCSITDCQYTHCWKTRKAEPRQTGRLLVLLQLARLLSSQGATPCLS